MPLQPDGPAPYAPAATILSVIERARERGLPTPVTRDVLVRAGVAETLTPRVLQSLQQLELINEDGTWTQNLETLRRAPEAEFQARFAEVIRSVYADVFQYVDPTKDSATAVRDAFRSYTPHGQQDRMVTLFTGLCQRAGLMPGEPQSKTVPRESRPSAPRVIPMRKAPLAKPTKLGKDKSGYQAAAFVPPPLAGLLSTLPESGWTKSDRDRFVSAFTAMLDYCIPVIAKADAQSAEENDIMR
jgi:hypothetical protein